MLNEINILQIKYPKKEKEGAQVEISNWKW